MRYWSVMTGAIIGIGIAQFLCYDQEWRTSEPLRALMVLFGIFGAALFFIVTELVASERKK